MSQVIYGPLTLPSGKVIKFRKPMGLDKMNILENMQISQDDAVKAGILLNNYLPAKVVTEVDNTAVSGNYKTLFNDWDQTDVDYYTSMYIEMFGMTEARQNDIKEKAAFLLNNSTSTDGSSSQSPAPAA